MPEFTITNPEGKEFVVTAPDGATQDEVLSYAKGQFAKPTAPAAPAPTSRGGVQGGLESIDRAIRGIGTEFAAGAKQAFTPEYSEPNKFDKGLSYLSGGLISPEASQRNLSTPASQALGVARMVGSPGTGLVVDPAMEAITKGGKMLGLPDDWTDVAAKTVGLGAGVFMPGALANAIPNAARSAARGATRAARPVLAREAKLAEAEALNTMRQADATETIVAGNKVKQAGNEARMAESLDEMAGRTARAQEEADLAAGAVRGANKATTTTNDALTAKFTKDVADREAALSNVARYEAQIATPGKDALSVNSPLARKLRATETDSAAYAKFDEVKATQTKLDDTASAVASINERFGEGVAPSLKPTSAIRAAEGIEDASSNNEFIELAGKLRSTGNNMALADVQTNMRAVGRMIRSPDKLVSEAASELYWSMAKDLGKTAEGRLLLEANKLHRQNAAADGLGSIIASSKVSKFDDMGNLTINAEGMANALKQNTRSVTMMKESLPPAQLQEITDTLAAVYRAKRVVPDVPKAPKLGALEDTPGATIKPTKFNAPKQEALDDASATLKPSELESVPGLKAPKARLSIGPTRAILAALGIPFTGGVNAMVALAASYVPALYSRMIFNVAAKPGGSKFLRNLYADAAPGINDAAKVSKIRAFLGDVSKAGSAASALNKE